MILNEKKTTVAYRCPSCGAGVMSVVGLFGLNSHMVKLKCDCGKSEMTMVMGDDRKVRFTVPCIFCPNPHSFTVSSNLFFNKDIFLLPCPYSDINIAMVGEINHVRAELSRSELELIDLLEKSGLEGIEGLAAFNQNDDESGLGDPQVFDIIKYVITELDEEGKISCKCPKSDEGESEGDYEIEIFDEAIKVSCKRCGASKTIPTNSLIAANDFLNIDSLELE